MEIVMMTPMTTTSSSAETTTITWHGPPATAATSGSRSTTTVLAAAAFVLLAASAQANNPSCQAGTGTNGPFQLAGSYHGLCISCQGAWPTTGTQRDTTYNVEPYISYATCGTTNTQQYWQMTGHIAGYSGDGNHPCPGSNCLPGDCGLAAGTRGTYYPNINNHTTNWTQYTQTDFPPVELGYYTSPAPLTNVCNANNLFTCNRWTQMQFQACGHTALTSLADAQEDLERNDIMYETCHSAPGGDGCIGEDACNGTPTLAVNDTLNTTQGEFLCGAAYPTQTAKNRFGNAQYAKNDLLPIQLNSDGTTVDSPAEFFCSEPLLTMDIDSTTSTWTMGWDTVANTNNPILIDWAPQTWPTGSHKFDERWESDMYITFESLAGQKQWPECTIEYDVRLNPCPSTVCPCATTGACTQP